MRYRIVFVAGMICLSGCMTAGPNGARPDVPAGGSPVKKAAASTIIASMGGGLVGGAIGAKLDDADRRTALQAEYRALEYTQAGEVVPWKGAGSNSGEVTAAQPYRVGSQDCRQYSHAIVIEGLKQTARGTACRNPDGSWTPLT